MKELLKRTIDKLNEVIDNSDGCPDYQSDFYDGKISALLDVVDDMAAMLGMTCDIDPMSGRAYVYTPKNAE